MRCAGTVEEYDCALLLPHDAPKVRVGEVEKALQLRHPVFADFAGRMRSTGIVQKLLGLLLVGPRHVEGVFQGCVVLEGRVVFHENSVVPFPG